MTQKNRVGSKLQETGISGEREGKMEAVWNQVAEDTTWHSHIAEADREALGIEKDKACPWSLPLTPAPAPLDRIQTSSCIFQPGLS